MLPPLYPTLEDLGSPHASLSASQNTRDPVGVSGLLSRAPQGQCTSTTRQRWASPSPNPHLPFFTHLLCGDYWENWPKGVLGEATKSDFYANHLVVVVLFFFFGSATQHAGF